MDLTLREARRLVGRATAPDARVDLRWHQTEVRSVALRVSEFYLGRGRISLYLDSPEAPCRYYDVEGRDAVARLLDRLISRHGPDWPEVEVEPEEGGGGGDADENDDAENDDADDAEDGDGGGGDNGRDGNGGRGAQEPQHRDRRDGFADVASGHRIDDYEIAEARADIEPAVLREIERALRRVLASRQGAAGTRPIPRVHPRGLVREMAARRIRLSRARRTIAEATTLITVDLSGSCAVSAPGMLAVAWEMARTVPDLIVVAHDNGHPVGVKNAPATLPPETTWAPLDWWRAFADANRVGSVIALGDHDAAPVYQVLAERARLVWLDHYGSRRGVREPVHRGNEWGGSWGRAWARPPVAVMIGVNHPPQLAYALRELARRRVL